MRGGALVVHGILGLWHKRACVFLAAACPSVLETNKHLEGLLDDPPRRTLAEVAEKADTTIAHLERAPAPRYMMTQGTKSCSRGRGD